MSGTADDHSGHFVAIATTAAVSALTVVTGLVVAYKRRGKHVAAQMAAEAQARRMIQEFDAQKRTIAHQYRPFLEPPGRDLAALRAILLKVCNDAGFSFVIAVAGDAGAGKSSLLNAWASILCGKQCDPVPTGGVVHDGVNTMRASRHALTRFGQPRRAVAAAAAAGGVEKKAYDLIAIDMVGHTDRVDSDQVILTLLNKLGSFKDYDPAKLAEYLALPARPEDAARALNIAVPASLVMNTADDKDPTGWIAHVRELKKAANNYSANHPDTIFQLPVKIIITKADEYAKANGITDPRWLLCKSEGPFAPLYERLKALTGIPAKDATVIGWVDSELDYMDYTDPRIIVLMSLLEQMADAAEVFNTVSDVDGFAAAPPRTVPAAAAPQATRGVFESCAPNGIAS